MLYREGRFVILLVSLFLPASVQGQQGNSFKYRLDGNLSTNCIISPDHNITINYSNPEVDIQSIRNSYGDFYRISIPGHNNTTDPGKPELPVFSRLITIPENSQAVVTIHDVRSQKLVPFKNNFTGRLYPKQADQVKDSRQKTDFIIDKNVYAKKGLINADTVTIEHIGKVRNNQLATIFISPVRYNPYLNELEVITSMRIEVTFKQLKGSSSASGGLKSALFEQSVGKGTLNYYPPEFITGYSTKPVGMVILTDTIFRKQLKPFITWKTQEGFRITTIYKGTWPAGSTFSGIKDSLSRIYYSATEENPAPEYLLIVGDVNKIPLSEGTSQVSDLYYGEFDGNGDYLPEMFIGRLPVADTTDLKNVVNKLVQYEKFQFPDTSTIFNRTIVTAGNDGSYITYMNGQVKYAATYYLNTTNGIDPYAFYYPKSASSEDSIKKLIASGVSFINYTGHGDGSGWIDPYITDIPSSNMYPFMITNACQTAHFNNANSFGNRMIVSASKASGYIGCSNDSYWDEDYYWAVGVSTPSTDPIYSETGLGAFDRLFHKNSEKPSDWYITMGQVNWAGNMSVSASTSTRKKYYWETYTLLGDPSAIPIIGKPDIFNIHLPDTIPNNITSFSLMADPFAYASISHRDTLWDATYSSPSGSVFLKVPARTNDSCLITITGQNKVPLIKKIYIKDINSEFVNLTSATVNDSTGNSNGKADYNELFFLDLKINNLGLKDADSLSAKISTSSNLVRIINDSVFAGHLAGKSQKMLSGRFGMQVADSVPDHGFFSVDLLLKDRKNIKKYRIDVFVHSPLLSIISCYVDDTGIGNGNFIPEPGESVNFIFKVKNSGSSPATGIFGINSPQPGIGIIPPGTKSGTIPSGAVLTYTMPVSLSDNVPLGEYFTINSRLDCTPYTRSKDFIFRIGKTRENFEVMSFSIFPWINTSPIPWTITDKDAFDGLRSAQSGKITNYGSTNLFLKAFLSKSDSLRFYCKVSSELNYDFLTFKVNGNTVFRMSGESGWQRKSVALPQGMDKIEWIYTKDESVTSGLDCAWLDLIDFPVPSNMIFIQKDISVDRIKSPVQTGDFLHDSISVMVSNQGRDPINGFNLAYSVNNVPLGYEHFNDGLNNYLDSTTVYFKEKPDLLKYDIYDIKVFLINNSDDYYLNDTAETKISNIKIIEPFKVYPNPFTDNFIVLINSKETDEVTVTLTNSTGVVINSFKQPIIEGENKIQMDCPGLSPGFYYLTIKGAKLRNVNPLIKVK